MYVPHKAHSKLKTAQQDSNGLMTMFTAIYNSCKTEAEFLIDITQRLRIRPDEARIILSKLKVIRK